MKVQSINSTYPQKINYNQNFTGKQKKSCSTLSKAATTFGLWFGFGVGLDFLSRKIHFSKSPVKNSFAINGILASIATACVLVKGIFKKN